MAQIRSSSAELIAFFETGDVPTADQFTDLIKSFAVYDGTLPNISASAVGSGSFPYITTSKITGSSDITLAASFIPDFDVTHSLGSSTKRFKEIFTQTASINTLSSSLIPYTGNSFSLGSDTSTFKETHTATASIGIISSSLVPDTDNTYDLGSSTKEWKDLYVDGTAYIDTLDNSSAVTIVTASFTHGVSSSLLPDADDKWDLGSASREWKDLYINGTAYIDTLSLTSLDNNIVIPLISKSISISGSLFPASASYYNLGSSVSLWNNIHTNTVSASLISASSVNISTITNTTLTTTTASIQYISASSPITIGANLIPDINITHNLGSDTLKFKETHTATASIGDVSSSLVPDSDNTYDLGSSAKEWKDLYIDGTANIDTLDVSGVTTMTTSSFTYISSSLLPLTDDTFDLGSASKEWKDLYLDGVANIDTAIIDTASIGRIGSSLIPTAKKIYLLGSSSFEYKEAYIASASFATSASLSAIKFENLPTTVTQASLIGTGSLYLSGSVDSGQGQFLCVFTG